MEPKYVYIVQGELWPEPWSGYVSVYYATLKEEDAKKYFDILKRKHPQAGIEVTALPLDDTSCNEYLGGYSE